MLLQTSYVYYFNTLILCALEFSAMLVKKGEFVHYTIVAFYFFSSVHSLDSCFIVFPD